MKAKNVNSFLARFLKATNTGAPLTLSGPCLGARISGPKLLEGNKLPSDWKGKGSPVPLPDIEQNTNLEKSYTYGSIFPLCLHKKLSENLLRKTPTPKLHSG